MDRQQTRKLVRAPHPPPGTPPPTVFAEQFDRSWLNIVWFGRGIPFNWEQNQDNRLYVWNPQPTLYELREVTGIITPQSFDLWPCWAIAIYETGTYHIRMRLAMSPHDFVEDPITLSCYWRGMPAAYAVEETPRLNVPATSNIVHLTTDATFTAGAGAYLLPTISVTANGGGENGEVSCHVQHLQIQRISRAGTVGRSEQPPITPP